MSHLDFFDRKHTLEELKLWVEENTDFRELKDEDGNTALHLSVEFGTDFVVTLLDAGAEPNEQNNCGETPLHQTAQDDEPMVSQLLIDFGANLQTTDLNGNTPLHHAATYGAHEVARVLLQNGANANLQNNKGYTPLHFAVFDFPISHFNHYLLTTEVLLKAGADPRIQAKDQETVFDLAKKGKSHQKMLDLLIKYLVNPT